MQFNKILSLLVFCLFFPASVFCQGYLALVGGGSEDYNSWSDSVYQWMVEKGKYGNVVVLAYYDATDWIPDYFLSFGAASAKNIKIENQTQANDSALYRQIAGADIIFIKGGNQYRYYSRWRNTLVQSAMEAVYRKGGVIGGTSAGAMILSGIVFTAQYNTVYPEQALRNPYYSGITLANDFFSFLPDIFIDTHMVERGRLGRMIGFLARWNTDYETNILTIGVDDKTALLVEPDMEAEVEGSGAVTFFWQSPASEVICKPDKPLHFTFVNGSQLTRKFRFNLSTRSVTHIPPSAIPVSIDIALPEIPPSQLWVQGGDDFNYQTLSGKVLAQFYNAHAPEHPVIITNDDTDAKNSAALYENWFLNAGTDSVTTILLNENRLDDPETITIVQQADALILLKNNLGQAGEWLAGENGFSTAFRHLLNHNIPLLTMGSDGRLPADRQLLNIDNHYLNLYYGRVEIGAGSRVWPGTFIMTRTFEDDDFYENRLGGLLYGLANFPKHLGILIDRRTTVLVKDSLAFVSGETPVLFIDAGIATHTDSSIFRMESGAAPRQCVAIDGYTIHVIAPDESFNWFNRKPVTSIGKHHIIPPQNFEISNPYPNPFNGAVQFTLEIQKPGDVEISIYNTLGQLVESALIPLTERTKIWRWQPAAHLSSGFYQVQFRQKNQTTTKKVLLIK